MARPAFLIGVGLLALFVVSNMVHATPTSATRVIVYGQPFQSGDSHDMYQVRLLSAALSKVGVNHLLVPSPTPMLQERALRTIAANDGVDVFWSLTTPEREQQLRPVRFPIDKGLYGWRLLLVKAQPEELKIKGVADLQSLVFTQGHDWPDTTVLTRNGLQVVTSNNFASMVELVNMGRVDAFPRSTLEIWSEIKQHGLSLSVEPSVVIHYPIALYYFFSKDQELLAQQVERGLELLRQSGEFEVMFQAEFGDALRHSKLDQRRIISLQNPFLPQLTPLDRPELWYQPADVSAQPNNSVQP